MLKVDASVKLTRNDMPAFLKAMTELKRTQVFVGVPDDAPARAATPGGGSEPSNADIAHWMEYGVPEKNIPARPFVKQGIARVRVQVAKEMRSIAEASMKYRVTPVKQGWVRVGTIARDGVRAEITNGSFTPLTPATLAGRRAEGITGSQPLLATGQLRAAVTYRIQRAGSGS